MQLYKPCTHPGGEGGLHLCPSYVLHLEALSDLSVTLLSNHRTREQNGPHVPGSACEEPCVCWMNAGASWGPTVGRKWRKLGSGGKGCLQHRPESSRGQITALDRGGSGCLGGCVRPESSTGKGPAAGPACVAAWRPVQGGVEEVRLRLGKCWEPRRVVGNLGFLFSGAMVQCSELLCGNRLVGARAGAEARRRPWPLVGVVPTWVSKGRVPQSPRGLQVDSAVGFEFGREMGRTELL